MNNYRVTLVTKDNCLIQNRLTDREWWFGPYGFSDEYARQSLEIDCREKGVRLLSYTYNEQGITALVEWL